MIEPKEQLKIMKDTYKWLIKLQVICRKWSEKNFKTKNKKTGKIKIKKEYFNWKCLKLIKSFGFGSFESLDN